MKKEQSFEGSYNYFVKIFIGKFSELKVKRNQVIMLHVSLKDISEYTGLAYNNCTKLILDSLDYFSPKAVLIPSFTYSFVESGIYSASFSKSEVGRFSEEVRLNFAKYRLSDPIFSVMDTKKWLFEQRENINPDRAFGHGTLWSILKEENCKIINIGLKNMILTHIHHIEEIVNVPYRSNIIIKGVKHMDRGNFKKIEYTFFARNLSEGYLLDWNKIRKVLYKNNAIYESNINNINFSLVSTKKLHSVFISLLGKNKFFLVKK